MDTHYAQSNQLVKPDRFAAQRLAKWLLILAVLAGTVWLMASARQRNVPVAPATPAGVSEPISPPSELFLPTPHGPADPQFLAADPWPTALTVRTGPGLVLWSGGTSEFKL